MKDREIINIGGGLFALCFLLGNICLFGFMFTRDDRFMAGGYMLLVFGSILNMIVISGLLLYGLIICQAKLSACIKAIGILLINIPLAIVYALIGLSII
ncbi:hypothetical protein [Chryseobacterium indologenes]|uniref:Branched-chain amino acid:cation transporter, LIVCS family n=1 Tax=Chryseobacterium indologenes TaxID=253 RepID=A0A0N1KRY8_CHRID|nr:hypothetical protein [Chryseobacterium indologenes]KPE49965.1 hypothetical protein AOB46_17420 [Chryseobacterium indologenes]